MHLNRNRNVWVSYLLQIQIVYILQFLALTQCEELFSKMCNPFFPQVQPLSADDILKHKLHKCFRLHAYPLGKRNHVHVSFRQWPLIKEEHCKKFIALNISLQAFNKKSWPFGRWLSTSLHHPELCSYEEASIKIEAIQGHVQDCDGLMKLEDVKMNPVGTIQQNPTNLRRVNMYKYGFQKWTQNKGGICTTWTYSPKNFSVRVASELGGVRNAKKYFSHFHVTFLAELLVVPENKTKIKPFLYSIQSNAFEFDGNYTTDHHESHCHRAHPSNKNFRPLVFFQDLLLPKVYSDLLLNLTGRSRSSSINTSKSNSSTIILNGNSIQISHLKKTVPSVPHNTGSSTSHKTLYPLKQLRTLGPLQNKQKKQLYSRNPSKSNKKAKNRDQVSVIMLNHDKDMNTVLNEIVSAILSVSNNNTKVLNPNLNLIQHLQSLDDKEANIKSAVSTAKPKPKPNKMIGLGRNVIGINPSNSEKQLKTNEDTNTKPVAADVGKKPSKKIAGRSIIQNNMNSLDNGGVVNGILSGRTTRSINSGAISKSKNWWGKKKTKNIVKSIEPEPTQTYTTDKPLNLEWTTATAIDNDIVTTPTTVTEEEYVTMPSTATTTTTTVPAKTTSTTTIITTTTTRVPTTTSASTPTTTTTPPKTSTTTAAPTTTHLTTTPPPETTSTGSTLTTKKVPQIPVTTSLLKTTISPTTNKGITTKVTPKPLSYMLTTTGRVKSKGRSSKRGKKKDKVDKPIRTVQ